jgi:hypothetical protein
VTTYEEWRVIGHPGPGFPPYTYTWSQHHGDPERAARGFMALIADHERWADGPHLHKRTVTVTEWTREDA